MPNRLAGALSPYLLQHAANPVDWYPWGEEAFAAARERDVPIFLSIGYSACHWCHVMAHESFEDDEVAALLNERFVNVKVDREERPDVDAVHMRVVQSLTGRGGWPMSVFLTPEKVPFFAGTYWPRVDRSGIVGFPTVIDAVSEAWRERREEVVGSARNIAEILRTQAIGTPAATLDAAIGDEAASGVLSNAWDRRHGGFGRAPRFPHAMTIEWLLHRHVRTGEHEPLTAALQALDAMARGGIHDQLAGGFARYSTDAAWLVPHFEKMLYDNALLLAVYATGAHVSGRADLAVTATTTAGYLLSELRTAEGSFVSAIDADSEGEEGRHYVWSHAEFVEVVADSGHDPALWADYLGVTPRGNWEGTNVLHRPVPDERFAAEHGLAPDAMEAAWETVRSALLARRRERIAPGVDDKVLTDWNALCARGLTRAGVLLEEPSWIAAAAACASALHDLHTIDGQLFHTSRRGRVAVPGFLEDHALLALADLELFQATGEGVWFRRGQALAERAHERFHDPDSGGWFQTAADAEELYVRPKDAWDNAVPAGTSVMVEVCLLLAGLTGDGSWRGRAEEGIRSFQEAARTMGTGYGWLLRQVEALASGPREVAVVGRPGPDRDRLARVARRLQPGTVVVVSDIDHGDRVPLLAGRGEQQGRPAAYVCRDLACERPVTDPGELAALLAV